MKKFLSMLLILALAASVFTACGDKPASSGSTTDAPAASSSEPEPQEPPYDPAVLTGLPKSDDYPEGQRVTAVMVNNISNTSYQQARPQNGLSEADVLIEIKVEGGITRFCAGRYAGVWHDGVRRQHLVGDAERVLRLCSGSQPADSGRPCAGDQPHHRRSAGRRAGGG